MEDNIKTEENRRVIKISVRDLVEFVMRSGDIDSTRSSSRELDAMKKGTKLHKKVQKSMARNYLPEIQLKEEAKVDRDDIKFAIAIEGRADGIILPDRSKSCDKSYREILRENFIDRTNTSSYKENNHSLYEMSLFGGEESISHNLENYEDSPYVKEDRKHIIIHEIKGVLRDVNLIKEPVSYHRAQAMCYAYIYAKQNKEKIISIRVSYYNLESENSKHFGEVFTFEYLDKWFEELMKEYTKWAYYRAKWEEKRNNSIKKLEFPFEYRPSQRKLVADVYRTIIRDKKLYLEAPTGVGKTISTVFPAIKSLGEEVSEKIFYLTAKTITRTAAENTFRIISGKGTKIKFVTITAKEKICCNEQVSCNPVDCPRAKGHFDRVNDAVFELINNENDISREVILDYAAKYKVCPFEMCLDVSLWVDAVICDYNYVFDPNVYLRRFFEGDIKQNYVFLIDEAHNLVERACEMYSALLVKEDFLTVKKLVDGHSTKLSKALEACNKELLKFKRICEDCEVIHDFGEIGALIIYLMRAITYIDEFTRDHNNFEYMDTLLELYFDMRHFVNMYDLIDDDYLIYTYFDEYNNFKIQLRCMNPSRNLKNQLKKGKSAIFFSATLLPIRYYMGQLGADDDDYAVYAPSEFDKNKRNIMVAKDVSTKYTRRNDREYMRIANYIEKFIDAKIGNYFVFFPSYIFMEKVYEKIDDNIKKSILLQDVNMTEGDKEDYLYKFEEVSNETKVGFCVLGGIFSEGIDLKNDRLIGAVVVGTGLPMVCTEREIYRGYYDDVNGNGFEYAYLYAGMNKVLQAAGRVIRTYEDIGQILLLDERLLTRQYQVLFPREWFPYDVVSIENVEEKVKEFWMKNE